MKIFKTFLVENNDNLYAQIKEFNFCREKLEENRKGVGRLKEKKRTRPTQRNKCSKKFGSMKRADRGKGKNTIVNTNLEGVVAYSQTAGMKLRERETVFLG